MTQTTLYSDKKLFVSFYKNTLSRLKGVALLYGILMFITYPMFYIIAVGDAMERMAMGRNYYGFEGYGDMYTTAAIFFFAVIVAAVVTLGATANNFMHGKRSVDVFHALPVRRPVMLLANFAAVMTLMFVTEAVCYLTVAVVSSFTIPIPFAVIAGEFVRVFVLTGAIAAIYTFCAVCCNTVLDSAIFTFAFNFIVPGYTVLFISLMHEYVEGFASGSEITLACIKLSPVCMLYQCFVWEELPYTLMTNLIYIAFTALVLFVSSVLYVKRKSEKAQSNNINGFAYRFIFLAASVGGGAFFGYAIGEGFGWVTDGIAIILLSCVFSAVIYLIFSTVTSRRVNPGKKGLLWLLVGAVLTAGIFGSMMTGFFGFETYLPHPDDIERVQIFYGGEYENITRYEKQSDGKYKYVYGANGGVVFEDPQEIDIIRNMHRIIVENLGDKDSNSSNTYHGFEVTYTLKNGRTVMRNYYRVPTEVIRDYMIVEDMDTFKRQMAPVLISPASDLSHFVIKDGFGQNQQRLDLTESEKELLYNAIAQDTLNRTSQMKKQHNEMSLARIALRYKSVKTDNHGVVIAENSAPSVMVAGKHYYDSGDYWEYEMYSEVCFEVCESSINTIKALKQLGLEQYTTLTQPENMKAVVALDAAPYYSNVSANFWMTSNHFEEYGFADQINWNGRSKAYYDAEQIAQIAQACTSIVYSPAVGDEAVFAVVFAQEDADLRNLYESQVECICYYMPYDQAPQFLKDDFIASFGVI